MIAYLFFVIYVAVGIYFTNQTFRGRSEARAALQREMETVQVFLREYEEGTPDWLWETEAQGRIARANRNMATALGRGTDGLHGQSLAGCFGTLTPDAADKLAHHLAHATPFRDLVVAVGDAPAPRWLSLTGHPVYDEQGQPAGFRGIGRDITTQHQAQSDIAFMAEHDGLTGLLNRPAFLARLADAAASGTPVTLALIDLDNFKAVNDTYGHAIGDLLLRQTAQRLAAAGTGIVVARLGGDEFAAMVIDAGPDQAIPRLDALHRSLSDRVTSPDIVLTPAASMGLTCLAPGGGDHQQLMLQADLALYSAKREGKNRFRLFSVAMEQDYTERLRCESELGDAIARGQIIVAYQAIVDVVSGQTVACEALARWQHPERGLLLPGAFIEIAERIDLIDHIGERVLRVACHEAVSWNSLIQVNVNLSPRQLQRGNFVRILAEALHDSGLPPTRLGIEVTERTLLDDDESTRRQLADIRAMGVKLILDDFGSGYSSLSYLQDIDVDGIKIDASFTGKLGSNKVRAICRMVARLAMELNVYVVAEGVETREQLDWLRLNGIAFGQGFLLGRPTLHAPDRQAAYLAL
ncbi:putative bifunctional diguanylate cyclase/phosphodiesterase [Endobacter medicaginis]|nr:EAL domain-containing protein [Endobacter medicaginis]